MGGVSRRNEGGEEGTAEGESNIKEEEEEEEGCRRGLP